MITYYLINHDDHHHHYNDHGDHLYIQYNYYIIII